MGGSNFRPVMPYMWMMQHMGLESVAVEQSKQKAPYPRARRRVVHQVTAVSVYRSPASHQKLMTKTVKSQPDSSSKFFLGKLYTHCFVKMEPPLQQLVGLIFSQVVFVGGPNPPIRFCSGRGRETQPAPGSRKECS